MLKAMTLLKPGNFRALFFAITIGTTSEMVFGLTGLITVSKQTGSALSIGLMVVLTTLPTVCLAPFQGVVVDRFDKTRLAVWSNLIRAAVVLLTVATVWFDLFSVTVLYVCIFCYYILWYFLIPTTESLLKEVLPKGESVTGMAIVQGAYQAGVLIAAPVAGLMVDGFGLANTFLVAASMDVASAIFFRRVKLPRAETKAAALPSSEASNRLSTYVGHYLAEIKAGWRYTLSNRLLLLLVIVAASAHPFFQAINTLLAPFVYGSLKGEAFSCGLIEGGAGLGSLLSAILCLSFMRLGSTGIVLLMSQLLLMLSLLGFSMMASMPGALLAYVAVGLFVGNLKVLSKSIVLEMVHREFSGRVMSAVSLLGLTVGIFTALGAGLIADRSIFYAYVFTSAFILLPCAATICWLMAARWSKSSTMIRSELLGEESAL
jgi:MFS family permease